MQYVHILNTKLKKNHRIYLLPVVFPRNVTHHTSIEDQVLDTQQIFCYLLLVFLKIMCYNTLYLYCCTAINNIQITIDNLYCYLIIQSVNTNILNLYKYAIDINAPTVSFSIQ